MKKIFLKIAAIIMVVFGLAGMNAMTVAPAYADFNPANDANILKDVKVDNKGSGIFGLINIVLTVLTYGVGAMGVLGLVWAGILYITAGDNEGKVTLAKKRIFEIVLGLTAWMLLRLLLGFLIPGLSF